MRYLLAFLSLLALANAQFGGFFDQMFGQQGGQQHHQQQNNPSDASHYRQRYDGCKSPPLIPDLLEPMNYEVDPSASCLRQVPLPRHPRLRPLPAPLSMRMG